MSQERGEFLARYGSAKHIEEYKNNPDWVIRSNVADNPLTDERTLRGMTVDSHWLVRKHANERLNK